MAPASLVPSLDAEIHLVLAALSGRDLDTSKLIPPKQMSRRWSRTCCTAVMGQPLRVIAEGWSQDVSEAMAQKVREIAEREDYELTQGTLDLIDAHIDVRQPTLPLW